MTPARPPTSRGALDREDPSLGPGPNLTGEASPVKIACMKIGRRDGFACACTTLAHACPSRPSRRRAEEVLHGVSLGLQLLGGGVDPLAGVVVDGEAGDDRPGG